MGRSAILGPDGRPYQIAGSVLGMAGFPDVHRQPPMQITGRFQKKEQFEAVVLLHKFGFFQQSTWLIEQMMSAAPIASSMQTRADKLTGTNMSFAPGRNNDKGRRAARDMEEDFTLIAPSTARSQMLIGGLMAGVKVAQKHWYVSETSGRAIPQVEPWSNIWNQWDYSTSAYRVWTWDGGWRVIPSPSLMVPGQKWEPPLGATPGLTPDDPRSWVVSEPFGTNSWRDVMALLYSLWEPYFGWALANNDMNAVCEQQGRGQRILYYPKVDDGDRAAQDEYIGKVVSIGSNAVIPLEREGSDVEKSTASYEMKAFEYPTQGWVIVLGTKESNASVIIGRILGHNTQGETQGAAGAGGGAKAGTEVRGDIALADRLREFRWVYSVLRDHAAANYGDPGLAPIPIYEIAESLGDVKAAQAAQFLSAALAELARYGVDTTEFLRLYKFPMRSEALVPGWTPPPKPAATGPETKLPELPEKEAA